MGTSPIMELKIDCVFYFPKTSINNLVSREEMLELAKKGQAYMLDVGSRRNYLAIYHDHFYMYNAAQDCYRLVPRLDEEMLH